MSEDGSEHDAVYWEYQYGGLEVRRLISEDEATSSHKHASYSLAKGNLYVRYLVSRLAPYLTNRLLHQEHPIGARVRVGETTTISVHGQLAAGEGTPLLYEGASLAPLDKTQVLQRIDGHVGEGIVDHQVIHILVLDSRLFEGLAAGDSEGGGVGHIVHLADYRALHRLTRPQNVDRLLGEVAGPFGAGEDQRASTISHHTALKEVEGIADHAAVKDVFHRNQILHHRPGNLV